MARTATATSVARTFMCEDLPLSSVISRLTTGEPKLTGSTSVPHTHGPAGMIFTVAEYCCVPEHRPAAAGAKRLRPAGYGGGWRCPVFGIFFPDLPGVRMPWMRGRAAVAGLVLLAGCSTPVASPPPQLTPDQVL